jgi:periplasmic divalent cation tolerance protein
MPTVYVTAPRASVDDIARTVVEERLAACVNAVECSSTYRWESEIHEDAESILLIKTTDDRYGELVERIEELHPYDVPCIERFEETEVLEEFKAWRDDAVAD